MSKTGRFLFFLITAYFPVCLAAHRSELILEQIKNKTLQAAHIGARLTAQLIATEDHLEKLRVA